MGEPQRESDWLGIKAGYNRLAEGFRRTCLRGRVLLAFKLAAIPEVSTAVKAPRIAAASKSASRLSKRYV
jgi:hypothetical protein